MEHKSSGFSFKNLFFFFHPNRDCENKCIDSEIKIKFSCQIRHTRRIKCHQNSEQKKMTSKTHPATRRQPELYRCSVLPRRETNSTILSLEFPHQNLSGVYESIRIKPRSRFERIPVWATEEDGVFGIEVGQRGATKAAPSRRRLFLSSNCCLRRRNNPRGGSRERERGGKAGGTDGSWGDRRLYIGAREGAEGRERFLVFVTAGAARSRWFLSLCFHYRRVPN